MLCNSCEQRQDSNVIRRERKFYLNRKGVGPGWKREVFALNPEIPTSNRKIVTLKPSWNNHVRQSWSINRKNIIFNPRNPIEPWNIASNYQKNGIKPINYYSELIQTMLVVIRRRTRSHIRSSRIKDQTIKF